MKLSRKILTAALVIFNLVCISGQAANKINLIDASESVNLNVVFDVLKCSKDGDAHNCKMIEPFGKDILIQLSECVTNYCYGSKLFSLRVDEQDFLGMVSISRQVLEDVTGKRTTEYSMHAQLGLSGHLMDHPTITVGLGSQTKMASNDGISLFGNPIRVNYENHKVDTYTPKLIIKPRLK